ncbi:PTS sugar transporter subunit IIB [Lacticaseibacillus camelliae]|uniref:PTS sugar transporter subunit IIB n=1 Tax=Lacticaseibacillus camelliae TaxID=381742 RepID=UPI000ACBA32E|nr:hypothetical protein [Lacticaseibacillus camelliae]
MKISLFCNAGMSTSLVAAKMKKYYEAQGKDYDVEAYDFSQLLDEGDESDVIVLAPQVGWLMTIPSRIIRTPKSWR